MSSDGGANWRQVPDVPQASPVSGISYVLAWFVDSNGEVYAYPAGSPTSLQRYDPSRNAWNAVTTPPIDGALLALTPGNANSDVLWFVGSNKGQSVLDRYVV
jgi:hypothetical protein